MPANRNHPVTDVDIAMNQSQRERAGYAPDPECKVCHGAGFLHPMFPDGRTDYSRAVTCAAQDCLADSFQHFKSTGEYLALKGISVRLQTFAAFKQKPGNEKAFKAFYQLSQGNARPFLLCYGGVGSGKTHLCQALTTELVKRGVNTHYYSVSELMRTLRDSMQDHTTDEWLKSLANMDGLVLDDYGREHETDWTSSTLEDVIDARWQNRLITVLTTNKDIIEVAPRIKSRFLDVELSVIVNNSASDYRPVRKS